MVGATTILAVDDEPGLTELYEAWLDRSYAVRTATGGAGALTAVDDDVDAVLLDRQMPDVSGDEVLREIRARGYDCPVALVTAAKPSAEVLELPYDEYLLKPIEREGIFVCVERLLEVAASDPPVRTCLQVASTATVLAEEFTGDAADGQRLLQRCEQVFERAAERSQPSSLAVFDDERFPEPPWAVSDTEDALRR